MTFLGLLFSWNVFLGWDVAEKSSQQFLFLSVISSIILFYFMIIFSQVGWVFCRLFLFFCLFGGFFEGGEGFIVFLFFKYTESFSKRKKRNYNNTLIINGCMISDMVRILLLRGKNVLSPSQ